MLGRPPTGRKDGADGRDSRLSALLQQWQGPDPAADFDAAVWRRVAMEARPAPWGLQLRGLLRERLLPHPVWAAAAATAMAALVGAAAGILAPAAAERAGEPVALWHAQTLAGSYVAMATGEAP